MEREWYELPREKNIVRKDLQEDFDAQGGRRERESLNRALDIVLKDGCKPRIQHITSYEYPHIRFLGRGWEM